MHAALRLQLEPLELIKGHSDVTGQKVRVNILKNTFAPCFDPAELDIIYNEGITKSGELFDLGEELAVITKLDTSYMFGDIKLGSERGAAIDFLKKHQSTAQQIEQIIRQKLISPIPYPSLGRDCEIS